MEPLTFPSEHGSGGGRWAYDAETREPFVPLTSLFSDDSARKDVTPTKEFPRYKFGKDVAGMGKITLIRCSDYYKLEGRTGRALGAYRRLKAFLPKARRAIEEFVAYSSSRKTVDEVTKTLTSLPPAQQRLVLEGSGLATVQRGATSAAAGSESFELKVAKLRAMMNEHHFTAFRAAVQSVEGWEASERSLLAHKAALASGAHSKLKIFNRDRRYDGKPYLSNMRMPGGHRWFRELESLEGSHDLYDGHIETLLRFWYEVYPDVVEKLAVLRRALVKEYVKDVPLATVVGLDDVMPECPTPLEFIRGAPLMLVMKSQEMNMAHVRPCFTTASGRHGHPDKARSSFMMAMQRAYRPDHDAEDPELKALDIFYSALFRHFPSRVKHRVCKALPPSLFWWRLCYALEKVFYDDVAISGELDGAGPLIPRTAKLLRLLVFCQLSGGYCNPVRAGEPGMILVDGAACGHGSHATEGDRRSCVSNRVVFGAEPYVSEEHWKTRKSSGSRNMEKVSLPASLANLLKMWIERGRVTVMRGKPEHGYFLTSTSGLPLPCEGYNRNGHTFYELKKLVRGRRELAEFDTEQLENITCVTDVRAMFLSLDGTPDHVTELCNEAMILEQRERGLPETGLAELAPDSGKAFLHTQLAISGKTSLKQLMDAYTRRANDSGKFIVGCFQRVRDRIVAPMHGAKRARTM
jgi:hypothetical protein